MKNQREPSAGKGATRGHGETVNRALTEQPVIFVPTTLLGL